MSKTTPSLKAILAKYMKSDLQPTEKMGYNEYKEKNTFDKTPRYAKGIREAYISSVIGASDVGNKEKAYTQGYQSSGYRDYLDSKRESTLGDRIDELREKQAIDERDVYTGYLSYLNDYEKRQASLSEKVRESLLKGNIADPRAAYTYAISKGLDNKSAEEVSLAVYEVMRSSLISSIAEDIASFKLNEAGAVSLARGYGLVEEDVQYIRELAKERRGKNDESSSKNNSSEFQDYVKNTTGKTLEEYLDELEKSSE